MVMTMRSKKTGGFTRNSNKLKNRFVSYIKKAYKILMRPEMGILPGQLAFFMLLSLVPIITLCGYVCGIFGIHVEMLVELIREYVPSGADFLVPYIVGHNIDVKLTVMFIWMFYLASNGFNSIILASNQVYGISKSNWGKRRIKAVLMTISMILLLIVILLFPVFGDKLNELFRSLNLNELAIAIDIIKTPFIWFIIFIIVKLLYIVSPDRVRKGSNVNIGAIFTTIGWIVITYLYRFLALNIATYNVFYGALSTIALLMLWFYFISVIFVIGMILNSGKEEKEHNLDLSGAFKVLKGY